MASPIPAGYHTVTPYIYVKSSADAIAFYIKAFDAVETMRLLMPDGSVAHAEVQIGDSKIMLADENLQWGNKSPQTLGGPSGGFCIYVPDVDAAYAKAVTAGATAVFPVTDQFYGDRSGRVADPFGHTWMLATHKEDMTPQVMQQRMEEWMKTQG